MDSRYLLVSDIFRRCADFGLNHTLRTAGESPRFKIYLRFLSAVPHPHP